MATTFYLHEASYSGGGTMPSGEQGAGTASTTWTGAATVRTMSTIIGTSQAGPTQSSQATTSAQRHFVRMFTSDPLAAQTLAAQTWRLNVADQESNTSANFWVNLVNLYVWRPSTGTKIGTIIDGSNGASQGGLEPTAANQEQTTTFTFSGSAVTCQENDVLILEVWAVFTQGMASAYTLTFYYDGTAQPGTTENTATSDCASYLESTDTLSWPATEGTDRFAGTATLEKTTTTRIAGAARLCKAGFAAIADMRSTGNGAMGSGTTLQLTGVDAPSGALIVVAAGFGQTATGNLAKPTVSGGGLTWTERISRAMNNTTPGFGWVIIWTAPAPSGLSAATITVTESSTSAKAGIATLWVVVDQDASPIGGSGFKDSTTTSAPVDVTLTAAATGSLLVGVFTDGQDSSNPTYRSDTTQDGSYWNDGGSVNLSSGHLTQPTSATGSTTFGCTTSKQWTLTAGLELKSIQAIEATTRFAGTATLEKTLAARFAGTATLEAIATGRCAGTAELQQPATIETARFAGTASLEATSTGRFAGLTTLETTATARFAGLATLEKTDAGRFAAVATLQKVEAARFAGIADLAMIGSGRFAGTATLEGTYTARLAGFAELQVPATIETARLAGLATLEKTATGRFAALATLEKTTTARLAGTANLYGGWDPAGQLAGTAFLRTTPVHVSSARPDVDLVDAGRTPTQVESLATGVGKVDAEGG